MSYIIVFVGGGIGASMRYGVNRLSADWLVHAFPLGTLLVNVAGSFLMGLVAALLSDAIPSHQSLRLFLGTGLLGGFTTFSAFSLEAVELWARGAYWTSSSYVVLSLLLAISGLIGGLELGRTVA